MPRRRGFPWGRHRGAVRGPMVGRCGRTPAPSRRCVGSGRQRCGPWKRTGASCPRKPRGARYRGLMPPSRLAGPDRDLVGPWRSHLPTPRVASRGRAGTCDAVLAAHGSVSTAPESDTGSAVHAAGASSRERGMAHRWAGVRLRAGGPRRPTRSRQATYGSRDRGKRGPPRVRIRAHPRPRAVACRGGERAEQVLARWLLDSL